MMYCLLTLFTIKESRKLEKVAYAILVRAGIGVKACGRNIKVIVIVD